MIKLSKERSNKKAFYNNNTSNNLIKLDNKVEEKNEYKEIEECNEVSDKDYVNVVKKVKKENITPDNIGEIMLCQIPGISSVTALSIMDKFKTLPNLLKELEKDENCLKDISNTNVKGQTRKINKTCGVNIIKYLLKK